MLLSRNLANHYTVQGKGIDLVFGEDIGGNPHIVYNNEAFMGVSVQKTESGPLASVTIEFAPDSHTSYLSIFVPPVNLPSDGSEQDVRTIAIFSKHKTHMAGPDFIFGQLIDYRTELLTGKATYVLS